MSEINCTTVAWEQFQQQFSTEESCANYFFHVKWPNGYICPRCHHTSAYVTTTRRLPLYECQHCNHQTSLLAGTILEGSRTSLRKWLFAFFLYSREQGVNAVELSQLIHVTYKTAWLILHKIRHAICTLDKEFFLSGIVRINASTYGRPHNPSIHAHPQEHPLLIGSSMNEDGESSYIKLKLISDIHMRERQVLTSATHSFTKQHVEEQTHDIVYVLGRFNPNRFRKLLTYGEIAKKWINGTFNGLGRRHLQAYLDEFSYRRNLIQRQIPIFVNLTHLCLKTTKITYFHLTRFA